MTATRLPFKPEMSFDSPKVPIYVCCLEFILNTAKSQCFITCEVLRLQVQVTQLVDVTDVHVLFVHL